MSETNTDYAHILEEYLKYYAAISIQDPRYHPELKGAPVYEKKYGTVHVVETVHKDDIKIRTIDVTDTAGKSFSFIIGPALMLFSSRYAKYREEFIETCNINGVISLKRSVISESMNPSAIIAIDKNCKPKRVWFSSASTIADILDLIFKEKSVHHKIYYSDTINKDNFSPEYYNLDRFSVDGDGNASVSIKELQNLAEIIQGKVIPGKDLKKSGVGYIRGRNLVNGIIQKPNDFIDISMANKYPKVLLQEGDILLTGLFGQRKIALVKSENLPAFAFGGLIIIRPSEISGKYLYRYLTSRTGKKAFDEQLEGIEFGFLNHISVRGLRHIHIPIYDEKTMHQIENIDSIKKKDVPDVIKNLLELSKCEKDCVQHIIDELMREGWKKESFSTEQIIQINETASYRSDLSYKLNDGGLVVFETKISIEKISVEWVNRIQGLLASKENLYFILTNGYYYEVHKPGTSGSLKLSHAPSIDELIHWGKAVI